MSGLFERGVLISLPGRELARTTPPASVFPVEALDTTNLSPALRDALDLAATCARPPRLIVARPEMFAQGETLAWLNQAIGGVSDHVALSDGETVRLVPGLRNHVFFYNLGESGRREALARLEARAPELFTQLHSQVNTALRLHWKGRRFAPPTQALVGDPAPAAAPALRPLAVHRHSLEESVARSLAAPAATLPPCERLDYLRLSASALDNEAVARRLTARLAETSVDDARALVWIAPPGADEASRVASLIAALQRGGGRLPGGALANVLWTTGDLNVADIGPIAPHRTLISDDFADFSRLAPGFPEAFTRTLIFAQPGRHMPSQFPEMLGMVYGPQVEIDWLRGRP